MLIQDERSCDREDLCLRSSDREVSLRGCGSSVDYQLILGIGGFLMGGPTLLGPKVGERPH